MSSLNNEHKQLLFDYCIGLTSQEQSEKAKLLISENKEANILHLKMKAVFKPLDSMGIEHCPDGLVERTMLRINNLPNPNKELTELLTAEQNKRFPVKFRFFHNIGDIVAIAAAIILVVGILVPTFGYARQKYFQQRCGLQMSNIFEGLSKYISDNGNKPPTVSRVPGASWWKIGDESESNTSHMYLLVKNGYVNPKEFFCPSCKKKRNHTAINSEGFKNYIANSSDYQDFPDRRFVDYSFPIVCQKTPSGTLSCRKALMADSNPIFEQLPKDYSKTIFIELKKEQLNSNSPNHNNCGQNVLFGDGRVEFMEKRLISNDDIFTLQDTDIYKGTETPSCSTDQFLAP